jgi:serine/threonine protein kinase
MSTTDWIGKKLAGRYQIEQLLGQGGMSAVFKANDPNLTRVVAIKMIHEHLSGDPGFVARFKEEAAAVAQLRHPNIVQVYDFDNENDVYFMVMEFIPGETLQSHLKRLSQVDRSMPLENVIKYMANICEAANYAHERGMIHRDIKPANIMLSVQRQAILMDFGIAKILGGQQHTATGATIGTAQYMSPEQITGTKIDQRSDIYSLGVTLFEMVSGRPPFEADSAMALMMMHIHDPVPDIREINPDVPLGLVAVINKALAKEKEDRYQTAGEMAAALKGDLKGSAEVPVIPPDVTIVEEPLPSIENTEITSIQPPDSTIVEPVLATQKVQPVSQQAIEEPRLQPSSPAGTGESIGKPPGRKINPLYFFIGGAVVLVGLIAIIFGGPLFSSLFPNDDGGSSPAAAITPTEGSDQVIVIEPQTTVSTPVPQTTTVILTLLETSTPIPGSSPTEAEPVTIEESSLVLWDLSHGPRESETGLSYDLDGMYNQLNLMLEALDFVLVPNLDPLESVDLDQFDLIVIAMPSATRQNFTANEAEIIGQFVDRGGSLLILAEAPGFTNRIREVTDYFNIDVGQSLISESALQLENHPIFSRVEEVIFMFGGGSLNVKNDQARVVASQSGLDAIVVIEDLPGKVVVIGDANLFDNRGLPTNLEFALHLFQWLK